MAKLYQQKLLALMSDSLSVESRENGLEIKRFFNGTEVFVSGVLPNWLHYQGVFRCTVWEVQARQIRKPQDD